MFESGGEVVVLTLSVVVTWMVAWAAAEWRAIGYQRRVRRVAMAPRHVPADRPPEIATVRVLPEELRRTA